MKKKDNRTSESMSACRAAGSALLVALAVAAVCWGCGSDPDKSGPVMSNAEIAKRRQQSVPAGYNGPGAPAPPSDKAPAGR
jgi:hypothetical protein